MPRLKEVIKALAERLDKEADLTLADYEKVVEERETALLRVKELEYDDEARLTARILDLKSELLGVMDAIDRVLKGTLVKSDDHKGVSGYVQVYVDYHNEQMGGFSEYIQETGEKIDELEETVRIMKANLLQEVTLRHAADTHAFTRAQEMVAGMYKTEGREETDGISK